jgi:hypothetical protein
MISLVVRGQQSPNDGPRFTANMELIRPQDYRDWIFLSAGVGMTYNPTASTQTNPVFDNVFVNPSSYRTFLKSGKWPDQTIFILENRRSTSEGSINKAGRFQTELLAVEANVKDVRLPNGWAWFRFGEAQQGLKDSAAALPVSAGCMDCHSKNGAVENTFVQFYPTLIEVARRFGTLKPGF